MKTGIPDADLILSLIQMMKMLEAPSCYSFHVNNPMQVFLFGSGSSGQRPTCHLSTDLSGFIVKEAPNPLGSYLRREPSAKTLWRDTRMMVLSFEVKSPFPISAQSWCVNPNRHRTEKVGRRFAPLWAVLVFFFQNYKKSSVADMLKVLSLFPLLTHAQKSSAFLIVETGLENLCSNLHHWDTARFLKSLLLICVNTVFLMLCDDK